MSEWYVGLISGTSMDGIDSVAVRFDGDRPTIDAALVWPLSSSVQTMLDSLRRDPTGFPAIDLARLDGLLGNDLAEAALAVMARAGLKPDQVSAIGSHGQNVCHLPDAAPPASLQVGDPHRIAQLTGVTVVADFRRADLAAGGQGAPLAPLLHRKLLSCPEEDRAVLNLGGIANLTMLPAAGGVSGFDSGPANCLSDDWYRRHHADGRYDMGGEWARSGQCHAPLLNRLLADPYFSRSPPKSTGIEHFNLDWLAGFSDRLGIDPVDVQATLVELSARTIAQALALALAAPRTARVIACGGGVHNDYLMERLAVAIAPAALQTTADFGIAPDYLEALLFAWLARERMADQPVDTRPITGASRPVLAGVPFMPAPS